MKINALIYGLLMGIIFCSCGDNDEASPSHAEKNWYVIEYDPNASELDQLRYDIYMKTGFPIYYNDTLNTQIRYDKGGNPYTYYEVFQTGYVYSGQTSGRIYTLQRDEGKIRMMMELLRDYVLEPYIAKEYGTGFNGRYGANAYLLVDTLFDSYKRPDSLYFELGVMALSTRYTMTREKSFISVDLLTEEEKERYGWNLAMVELKRYFEKNYEERFEAYYAITTETPDFYERWDKRDLFEIKDGMSSYNYADKKNPAYDADFTTNPRKYGVLEYNKVDKNSVYFPLRLEDLSDFTKMIYTKTDAEIRAEHGDYPMIIKRYETLLQLFKDSGLTQFIKEQ